MIAIVDTGGANLASLVNAFIRLERESVITSDPKVIADASHVILPGVGAAGDSMEKLRKSDLISTLQNLKQPTLGICLGMQLLFASSSEGSTQCLGILPGNVELLPQRSGFPVPHMGWNQIKPTAKDSPLLNGIPSGSDVYFVHSFAAPMGEWVTATCNYGSDFPAMVQFENYHGVQFHPEKSARLGARLLQNFVNL